MFRKAPFTTLDLVLRDAVVDARQGTVGALNQDEIDSAVDELLQLNGRRDHSYFLAGFRDAMFERQPARKLPAENAMQMRWYWAGAVEGWARSASWDRIVEAYDGNEVVPLLGDGDDPASNAAVESIVRALRHEDRTAELQTFVKKPAVANSRQLYCLLLDIGTTLLRTGDTAAARAILDILMRVEEDSPENGFPPDEWPFLQTRRRMAHCLRLLGEHLAARELLRGLLDHDSDPNIRAMVHADLGLLEGHFTHIADIRLPDDRSALADVVERLEKGEEHFRDAVEPDVRYAAHGHYCLGILALARESYEDADHHLDQARAHFRGQPKNYPDAILPRVDLYFGIARAQAFVSGKLNHASALIVSGLEGGESFPKFLIEPTVTALDLDRVGTGLAEVADSLLRTGGGEALDALALSEGVEGHLPLSKALYERAHRQNQGGESAASDLRDALRGYLKTADIETARRILDELEVLAARGVGVEAFVELLGESRCYEPAWDKEDAAIARARCYEVGGEYEQAFRELVPFFHRFTTKAREGDESALDEAQGVLCTISRYGLGPAYLEELENLEKRYEAVAGSLGDDESGVSESRAVRVLFVGGNERQAKADEAIRRRVAGHDDQIEITFVHSGLDSNWNVYAGKVERHLPTHQAVVIMRYIRTLLSEHIRKKCGEHDIPWRFCWSPGRGGAVEAVLKAAHAGRK